MIEEHSVIGQGLLEGARRRNDIIKTDIKEMWTGLKKAVTGEWRKVHSEELFDLYCKTNIISMMKSRRWHIPGADKSLARPGRKQTTATKL